MIRTVEQLLSEVDIAMTHARAIRKTIEMHEFDNARQRCIELAGRLEYLNREANRLADKEAP